MNYSKTSFRGVMFSPQYIEECRRFLEPYTGPIKQEKEERIHRFVNNEAPEYRAILAHIPEVIEHIDPEVSDDQLDLELYKPEFRLRECQA